MYIVVMFCSLEDLREIMHEQLALEQSRHELDKRESDNNLAVVLKRQKLYAMFPGVDPSALEELFQANRYMYGMLQLQK